VPPRLPPRPWLAPLALAGLAVALHLACGERYGFFRDELYFVACGQRLAAGYVDQPPLVALLARAAWWLSGDGRSVLLFRLPAALAHAGGVLVAAGIAARLGGGGWARGLAALAATVSPIQLAQGHLLTMNVLELLLWSGVALSALQAASGRPRAWLLAGALLGLTLLDKYSGAFLAVALLLGLLVTGGRAHLRSPWLWAGVALAAALALPAALWQWRHGWPFLELLENGRRYKNVSAPPLHVLAEAALQTGPAAALLALAGLAWLLAARAAAPGRFLGAALLALLAALLGLGAKPYYLAPALAPLVAAGAVALEARVRRGWLRGFAAASVLLSAAPAIPLVVPILPIDRMLAWQARLGQKPERMERLDYGDVPQHFADQLGWRERVAAVVAVVEALPAADRARAVIFTTNYGRAAALELLGGPGLPPVVSGHNQYFLWGVPGDPVVVVALGGRAEAFAPDFAEVSLVARTPAVPLGMPYESEIPIFVLRGPRAPVAELFRKSRHFE